MRAMQRKRLAFTLIELLIVIVVISILALIVIGRLMGATRKAKESRMQDILREMRVAIERYQGDTGEYPATLTDIVAQTKDDLSSGVSDDAKRLYAGPYIAAPGSIRIPNYWGLPANPYILPTESNVSLHWSYDNTTGTLRSAVSGVTLSGIPYSNL